MKGRLLFVGILSCLMAMPLRAYDLMGFCQTYYEDCGYSPSDALFRQFSITEATTINGVTYYKAGYKALLRVEGEKILLRTETAPTEYVLYDFSLQVGDVVRKVYYDDDKGEYSYKSRTGEVSSTPDTVMLVSTYTLLNGEQRKMLTIGRQYVSYRVVEGIGSIDGDLLHIIEPYEMPTCRIERFLVCTSIAGNPLFALSEEDSRELGLQGDKCGCFKTDAVENVSAPTLVVSPNPTNGVVHIESDKAIQSVAVYQLDGQKITEQTGNAVELYAASAGVYIVHIYFTDGSVYTDKVIKTN